MRANNHKVLLPTLDSLEVPLHYSSDDQSLTEGSELLNTAEIAEALKAKISSIKQLSEKEITVRLKSQLADVLLFDDEDTKALDEDETFIDLGLDSIVGH